MMKLCPIRYGGAVIDPTPSGNVWLVYDAQAAQYYVADYNFTTFTTVSTGFTTELLNGSIVRVGSKVYFKDSATMYYAEWDNLNSWSTSTAGFSTSSTSLFNFDGSIFSPAPTNVCRFALPTGGFTELVYADAPTHITSIGSTLYGVTNSWFESLQSTDNGASWSLGGVMESSPGGYNKRIATDGADLVVAYLDNAVNELEIRKSTDFGASWSSVAYTSAAAWDFPLSEPLKYHEGKYYCFGLTENVNSSDGSTWTDGTATPEDIINVAFGVDRIAVGAHRNKIYYTDDNASTWQEATTPFVTGVFGDYVRIYWIGDPP